jgi:outer membrane immunogenic protein
MKKLLLSTVAVMSLASAAAAADLPARSTLPAFSPVSSFTWTGFYIGAHAGYLWNDSDAKVVAVDGLALPMDVELDTIPRKLSVEQDGVMGGIQTGYNMQIGMFVVGVEADVSWTDVKGDETYSALDRFLFVGQGIMTNTVVESELEWLATFRGRAGVAIDRALFFVTGGAAVGEVNNSFSINIPDAPAWVGGPYFSPNWNMGDTEWGWTVGAGIEYAIANNISVKAEYLYYDLGDHRIHGTDRAKPAFALESIDYKFKNNGNIARAGVNLRF